MIHQPGRIIPIVLGTPPAGSSADFIGRPPITYVQIINPDSGAVSDNTFEAVVDTGADVTVIDAIIAEKLALNLSGNGYTRGFGGQTTGVKRARVQIKFPTANLIYEAPNAGVLDFKAAGHTFDVVLGRGFLKHCILSVDGPNAAYQLRWVG